MDYNKLVSDTKKQFKVDSDRLVLSENKYFYFISSLFPTDDYKKVNYPNRCLMDGLWKIFTLINRIENTNKLSELGIISNKSFLEFEWLRVDIGYIHYEMRSVMDYICQCLEKYLGIVIKDDSYNELLKINDIERSGILGSDILNIVRESDGWFKNLRDVRGTLIHNGKNILPFDTKPEFSFTIVGTADILKFLPIDIRKKMKTPNYIFCVPYLSIYMCLILNLLDKIGEKLLLRTPTKAKSPIMLSIDGLDTFNGWLDRTETLLK